MRMSKDLVDASEDSKIRKKISEASEACVITTTRVQWRTCYQVLFPVERESKIPRDARRLGNFEIMDGGFSSKGNHSGSKSKYIKV